MGLSKSFFCFKKIKPPFSQCSESIDKRGYQLANETSLKPYRQLRLLKPNSTIGIKYSVKTFETVKLFFGQIVFWSTFKSALEGSYKKVSEVFSYIRDSRSVRKPRYLLKELQVNSILTET